MYGCMHVYKMFSLEKKRLKIERFDSMDLTMIGKKGLDRCQKKHVVLNAGILEWRSTHCIKMQKFDFCLGRLYQMDCPVSMQINCRNEYLASTLNEDEYNFTLCSIKRNTLLTDFGRKYMEDL